MKHPLPHPGPRAQETRLIEPPAWGITGVHDKGNRDMWISGRAETCQHDRHGRFCSKCGIEFEPARLTFHALWAELTAGWLQKGFRQTAIGLLLAPGRQIRTYIRMDRNLLVKPVSYLIVISAFQLWVFSLYSHGSDVNPSVLGMQPGGREEAGEWDVINWILHHYYQFELALAGFTALLLRFVFYRRSGYSMPEIMIFMTYVLAQSLLLQTVLSLVLYLCGMPLPVNLRTAVGLVFTVWAIGSFMEARTVMGWLRAIGSYATVLALVALMVTGAIFYWIDHGHDIKDAVQEIEQTTP